MKKLYPPIANGLIISIVLFLGLDLSTYDLNLPFNIIGDINHHLTMAKAISEQGWWWTIERLSAPFELDMLLAPLFGQFDVAIIWVLSIIIHNPAKLLNVFFLVTFILSGTSSFWVLRENGIRDSVAIIFSVLFALSPFAFYRFNHLMLTTYTIPLVIGFSYRIITGTVQDIGARRIKVYFASAIILGLNYIYTTFFACFIVSVSLLIAFVRHVNKHHAWMAGKYIIVVLFFCVVNYLPSVVHWKQDPIAKEMVDIKSAVESETFGLKIRHLLTPIGNHKFPPIQHIERKIKSVPFLYENENHTSRLGTVGSLGFLLIIFVSLVYLSQNGKTIPLPIIKTFPLCALTLAAVLLATIGGLGSLFNILVSPDIRAYNRISPFIHFMSLFALAFVVHDLTKKWSNLIFYPVGILFLGLAIIDQAPFDVVTVKYELSRKIAVPVKQLTEEVESRLSEGAMVYQLPYLDYPHTPKVHNLVSHQHMNGYLFSKTLKWSWPAMSTNATRMNRFVNSLDPKFMVRTLITLGFDAIWVDRRAYVDRGDSLIRKLQNSGATPLSSSDEIMVLDLNEAKMKLEESFPSNVILLFRKWLKSGKPGQTSLPEEGRKLLTETLALGEMIFFKAGGNSNLYLGKGWSTQGPDSRSTVGKQAEIYVILSNHNKGDINIVLNGEGFVFQQHKQSIEIKVNDEDVGKFVFTVENPVQEMRVNVPERLIQKEKGMIALTINVANPISPQELGINTDTRKLGVRLHTIQFLPGSKG